MGASTLLTGNNHKSDKIQTELYALDPLFRFKLKYVSVIPNNFMFRIVWAEYKGKGLHMCNTL